MLQDLRARMEKEIERKRQNAKLVRDLKAVESDLGADSQRLKILKAQLEKEKIDVEELEKTSLKGLFYSVLGSKVEQLDKERQELLAAQLKYDQTAHQVRKLQEDQDYLNRQIERLAYDEADYGELMAQKEAFLRQSDLPVAAELLSLSEQIAEHQAEAREISEAAAAGRNTLDSLALAIEALKSARGWGTWDMLGGGIVSTAIKHSKIDDARRYIYEVQNGIGQFQRELADVGQSVLLDIELSGFESFADYFIDGLIFDWVVQSRIIDSLARCEQVYREISSLVTKLERHRDAVQKKIDEHVKKRERLIEGG
jgi:hypothetical protein